jgi:hypothetical protein
VKLSVVATVKGHRRPWRGLRQLAQLRADVAYASIPKTGAVAVVGEPKISAREVGVIGNRFVRIGRFQWCGGELLKVGTISDHARQCFRRQIGKRLSI